MAYLDKNGLIYFWLKLKALLSAKQDTLESGENIKTINNQSIVGSGNVTIDVEDGVGFDSIATEQDGTMDITLTNGDVITVDLNHEHTQYPKYVLCASEAEYNSIANKDSATLYLIPEE